MSVDIDLLETKAEVEAAFARYETALVANDMRTLDELFWSDARVLRYGANEILYGIDAIRAFRNARSPAGLSRKLTQTVITTFGRDFATASTLYIRESRPGEIGRQTQTWIRFSEGWKIVAAHVSVIRDAGAQEP